MLLREVDLLIRWRSICVSLVKSRARLEAEIQIFRHQIDNFRRKGPRWVSLIGVDRLIFVSLYRRVQTTLDTRAIIKPEPIVRLHRHGFGAHGRWTSRSRGGRPKTEVEIRQHIGQMNRANPICETPRVYGELNKRGIDVGRATVAKSVVRYRRSPLQGLRPFLWNRADGIASIHFFVISMMSVRLLQRVLTLQHGRRRLRCLG